MPGMRETEQDYGPCSLCPLPGFCLTNFSQRISFIRKVRTCRNRKIIKGDQIIIIESLARVKDLQLLLKGFPGDAGGKEFTADAGDARDMGSIPGWGRSPGEGNGNPF